MSLWKGVENRKKKLEGLIPKYTSKDPLPSKLRNKNKQNPFPTHIPVHTHKKKRKERKNRKKGEKQ